MKFCCLLLSLLVFSSCSKYSFSSFAYTSPLGSGTIPLVVPKGFKSVTNETDMYGNQVQIFLYPSGASLYVAHLKDTAIAFQTINDSLNQPQLHILGGYIFKGQEPDLQFWREIRRDHFRFGYKNVSRANEGLFDSSTNQMSMIKIASNKMVLAP